MGRGVSFGGDDVLGEQIQHLLASFGELKQELVAAQFGRTSGAEATGRRVLFACC